MALYPKITVSPLTVSQNGYVHVTGSGFTPNASGVKGIITVSSSLYYAVGQSNASSGGTVDFQLQIGDNVPVGTAIISVVDSSDYPSNPVTITVLSKSSVPPPGNPVYQTTHFTVNLTDPTKYVGSFVNNLILLVNFMEEAYVSFLNDSAIADPGKVVLNVDMANNSTQSSASPNGIGLSAGCFTDLTWGYQFGVDETINWITGHVAAGWPWADGSSVWAALGSNNAFPSTAGAQILTELGQSNYAAIQNARDSSKATALLLGIFSTYGWTPFKYLFSLTKVIGITDWTTYTEPLRSAIVISIMSLQNVSILQSFLSAYSPNTIPADVLLNAATIAKDPRNEGPTYDIVNGVCVDPGDGTGVWPTLAMCEAHLPKKTVSIYVNDLTTGYSSQYPGNNALTMNPGDSFTITGQVLPDPNLAAGDLEVSIPAIPNSTAASKVGVLTGGFYLYGPATVGPNTPNFTIQTTYIPTGDQSPAVTVTIGSAPPPPPPPPPTKETVSMQINDLTTGTSSAGVDQFAMAEGDQFTITGQVLPDPNLAAGDLEVSIPAIPGSTDASKVGVLAGGHYSYGPATIGPNTPNFTMQTTYIPTGDQSPSVAVLVASKTVTEKVTAQINDLTTGQSSAGTNALAMNDGDSFTITGQVLPDPNVPAGNLEVHIPAIPNSTDSSSVGVLPGGSYSYGPATVGPNTPNFTIQTTYIPTNSASPLVTVTIAGSTTIPPPPSWMEWLLAAGAIGLILLLAFLV